MAPFDERRAVELTARLDSVEREFAYWEEQSKAGAPLEKHHTQIRRVTVALRAFAEDVGQESETPGGRALAALLALDLHQIWDFFRGKLALRCVPWFQPTLIAADDFAWACYQPATAAAVRRGLDPAQVREPPLVFLSADAAARAHARGGSYAALIEGGLFGPGLVPALRELPLPVIAVPWYQIEHVPDALAIGHEVGHLVEEDLRLTETLRGLLAHGLGRGSARLPAWQNWLGEVFADVYGCLAAGPAYAYWLVDLLASSELVERIALRPDPDPYPPAGVRLSLVLACIEQLGFGGDANANELAAMWSSIRPDAGTAAFHADAERVAAAILDQPYAEFGDSLRTVISFGPLEQGAARDEAMRLLRGHGLIAEDVRVLLAAGAVAFGSDPQAFLSSRLGSRVLDHAVQLRQRGVRAGPARSIRPDVQAADRQAGRRLFEQLAIRVGATGGQPRASGPPAARS